MRPEPVNLAAVVADTAPDFWESLSERDRFVLVHDTRFTRRPEQFFPSHDWRSLGFLCGRGWGKSFAIACEINTGVEAGRYHALALMAQNETRADEIQVDFLVRTSPPWFKAVRSLGGVLWPNGARALVFTPEAPEVSRGGNFDMTWLCEIGAWPSATRDAALDSILTATRKDRAQYVWDTTSKGKNAPILSFLEASRIDPWTHVIRHGQTFDNPLLSRKYIRETASRLKGRRYQEELLGMVFDASAGALWSDATLDAHRRAFAPDNPEVVIVAVDPALSAAPEADETGLIVGCRGRDGHVYVTRDDSGRYGPAEMARIIVDHCARDASGVVLERNRGGDFVAHAIVSEAKGRGMKVELLPRAGKSFPRRRPGTIWIREVVAYVSKGERASGPAAETERGLVHLCGRFEALEMELTTYEPGSTKSPNRFDAFSYLVTELAGLENAPTGNRAADSAQAAVLQSELQRRLNGSGGRRGIGL